MIKKLLFIASIIGLCGIAFKRANAVAVRGKIEALKTDLAKLQTSLKFAQPGQEGGMQTAVEDVRRKIKGAKEDVVEKLSRTGSQKDVQEAQVLFSVLENRLGVAKRDVDAGNYKIAADVIEGIEAPAVLGDIEKVVEETTMPQLLGRPGAEAAVME